MRAVHLGKQQGRFKFGLSLFLSVLMVTAFVQQCFAAGQIVTDTITSTALKDNKLGDSNVRDMIIYLPPSYAATDKAYSVIYLLHGYGGNERSLVDEVGEPLAVLLIDGLISAGQLREVILVMPSAYNKYGGSYYLNSVLIGDYEDYIAGEVVEHVDAKYRTISSRNGRALAGASMGGYGSMILAMRHPETFGAVASLSPPLGFDTISAAIIPEIIKENPNGMGGPGPDSKRQYTSYFYALSAALSPNLNNPPSFVDLPFEYPSGEVIEQVRSRWLEADPMALLSIHGSSLMDMKGIYIDVGDNDLPGFPAAAEAFHQELMGMGIEHEYNVYHGGHSDNAVQRAIDSLKFLSDLLPDPEAPSIIGHADRLPGTWGGVRSQ